MTNRAIIDLSTAVEPTFTFTVDGEPYELRTVSHLSKVEEARLRSLTKREEYILNQVDALNPNNEKQMIVLHEKLFDVRVSLITMMTNLPTEIADKLGPMKQQKLVELIGLEVEDLRKLFEDEDDDDGECEDESEEDKQE